MFKGALNFSTRVQKCNDRVQTCSTVLITCSTAEQSCSNVFRYVQKVFKSSATMLKRGHNVFNKSSKVERPCSNVFRESVQSVNKLSNCAQTCPEYVQNVCNSWANGRTNVFKNIFNTWSNLVGARFWREIKDSKKRPMPQRWASPNAWTVQWATLGYSWERASSD
jgi:hypothetical protein